MCRCTCVRVFVFVSENEEEWQRRRKRQKTQTGQSGCYGQCRKLKQQKSLACVTEAVGKTGHSLMQLSHQYSITTGNVCLLQHTGNPYITLCDQLIMVDYSRHIFRGNLLILAGGGESPG